MDEPTAREIIMDFIDLNGDLRFTSPWVAWGTGDNSVTLDGDFSADELEAIAWWMRHKSEA